MRPEMAFICHDIFCNLMAILMYFKDVNGKLALVVPKRA